jgi:GAF domain-containing protein
VTGKKWKLVVHPLSGNTILHQFELEAPNWMGALRGARKQLGEEGGLPSGASCAVTPDGVVTILDGEARRRFLLSPIAQEAETPASAPVRPLPEASPPNVKPAKFRTIAYAPSPIAAQPPANTKHVAEAQPAKQTASPSEKQSPLATPAKRPEVANVAKQAPPSAAAREAPKPAPAIAANRPASAQTSGGTTTAARPASAPAQQASSPRAQSSTRNDRADQNSASTSTSATSAVGAPQPRAKMQLELMLSRDVEPGPENPLTYRERAYLIPKGMSVMDAEAALRFALAHLQKEFEGSPKGRFVNLAAFDHDWIDRPMRPPLVSLEWRDWRGEPLVDYPAAEQASMPPNAPEGDEALATVFESLHELAHLRTAVEGLEFSVRLLAHACGAEALSGCLYDINTDELRFVAVLGKGAAAAQGRAVSRNVGLFAKAAKLEHAALVIPDLSMDADYDAALEGRQGLIATNMLLRPLTHEGQLLGMLQLINRSTGGFSASDVHLTNYLAERLAEFLQDARARIGS